MEDVTFLPSILPPSGFTRWSSPSNPLAKMFCITSFPGFRGVPEAPMTTTLFGSKKPFKSLLKTVPRFYSAFTGPSARPMRKNTQNPNMRQGPNCRPRVMPKTSFLFPFIIFWIKNLSAAPEHLFFRQVNASSTSPSSRRPNAIRPFSAYG